jgi:hypothetical protein
VGVARGIEESDPVRAAKPSDVFQGTIAGPANTNHNPVITGACWEYRKAFPIERSVDGMSGFLIPGSGSLPGAKVVLKDGEPPR